MYSVYVAVNKMEYLLYLAENEKPIKALRIPLCAENPKYEESQFVRVYSSEYKSMGEAYLQIITNYIREYDGFLGTDDIIKKYHPFYQ